MNDLVVLFRPLHVQGETLNMYGTIVPKNQVFSEHVD